MRPQVIEMDVSVLGGDVDIDAALWRADVLRDLQVHPRAGAIYHWDGTIDMPPSVLHLFDFVMLSELPKALWEEGGMVRPRNCVGRLPTIKGRKHGISFFAGWERALQPPRRWPQPPVPPIRRPPSLASPSMFAASPERPPTPRPRGTPEVFVLPPAQVLTEDEEETARVAGAFEPEPYPEFPAPPTSPPPPPPSSSPPASPPTPSIPEIPTTFATPITIDPDTVIDSDYRNDAHTMSFSNRTGLVDYPLDDDDDDDLYNDMPPLSPRSSTLSGLTDDIEAQMDEIRAQIDLLTTGVAEPAAEQGPQTPPGSPPPIAWDDGVAAHDDFLFGGHGIPGLF